MKIVRVTYTTKTEYAEQNQANIKKVMSDLKELNNPNIAYNACLNADGKTFVHTAFFKTDEDNQMLLNLPSFKEFQQQLKASGPEVPPKQETPIFIDSSNNIFNS